MKKLFTVALVVVTLAVVVNILPMRVDPPIARNTTQSSQMAVDPPIA